jgi:hypothetical protein
MSISNFHEHQMPAGGTKGSGSTIREVGVDVEISGSGVHANLLSQQQKCFDSIEGENFREIRLIFIGEQQFFEH